MSSEGLNGHFTYHHSAGFDSHWSLYTTLDTTITRNILTSIFVVLNVAVGIVGAHYLKARSLRRLYAKDETKRTVPMKDLTSWLSLHDTLAYLGRTWQLPGGFYGILMLLNAGILHQYFVNSFVVPVTLQGQCLFANGLVTTAQNVSVPIVPSSTLCASATIYNAQYDVWRNGGEFGIYQMINYTSTNFLPTAQDVIGYWNCSYLSNSTINSTDWADNSSVDSYLNDQNFLFSEAFQLSGETVQDGDTYKGFLAWSANQQDYSTDQWIVRATLANNLTGSSAIAGNLECPLVSIGTWTPPTLPSQGSLTEWGNKAYGFLMGAEFSNYEYHLEWILNAMVMEAGSGNTDQWNTTSLPVGASQTYGCTSEGTEIRAEIWGILGGILVIFVYLAIRYIVCLVLEFFWPRDKDSHRADFAEAAPSTALGWQTALLREAMKNNTIEKKHTRDYLYGWLRDYKKYAWFKRSS